MANEGMIDRVLRVVLGVVLLLVGFLALGLAQGAVLGIVAAVIALVLVVTGAIGFCPAYLLLGLRTCPLKKPAE